MAIDIIIALNNIEVAEKIKGNLHGNGYNVLTICTYGNELIRAVRKLSPSIVISGYKFKDMTLIDIYNHIGDECGFLAIVNEPYKSFVQEETDIFCIATPINNSILMNSLDMIYQSERKVRRLKERVSILENKIEEKKIIEKAKGLIMKQKGLTEDEAFRYIQKNSMNFGLKMIDFSHKILLDK